MTSWQEPNPAIRDNYEKRVSELESKRHSSLRRVKRLGSSVSNRSRGSGSFRVECPRRTWEIEKDSHLSAREEIQWLNCATQVRELEQEIINVCDQIISRIHPEGNKEEKIRALKEYLRRDLHPTYVAKAVGCCEVYARNFCWEEDGNVCEKEYAKNRREQQADPVKRNQVIKRDSNTCVWCGKHDSDNVVHHVIPVSQGGTSRLENLALLCKKCHSKVHRGNGHGGVCYEGHDEFWMKSRYSAAPTDNGNSA